MRSLRTSEIAENIFAQEHCRPCLIANFSILIFLSWILSFVSPLIGLLFALLGSVIILNNGYLIPYTPVFAPKLVRLFRSGSSSSFPDQRYHTSQDGTDSTVTENLLQEQIVHMNDNEVTLDSEFEQEWCQKMRAFRALSDEELAERMLEMAPSAKESGVVESNGNTYLILSDEVKSIQSESWLSRPAAMAETAAAEVLKRESSDFSNCPQAAHAIGLFLQSCPSCGGDLSEEDAGGCCGPPRRGADGNPLRALVCRNCSVEIFTFEE